MERNCARSAAGRRFEKFQACLRLLLTLLPPTNSSGILLSSILHTKNISEPRLGDILWCEWRESNSHLKFGKLAY